ncbi:alpha-(1,3)-fucosyltransferase C-like [Portunus trituberculatus]|uniref:alpha-(1,3)-fucosyltransferase C-like n=1 Tax=Portunus trituberculatus TaxID=210409 RepID=UPI001E1CCC80|nr:alpha-(1,3)-fucosyltransferase C-like [Portunus trituberculatus]
MKNLVRLPAFYLCLVLFAVVLVLFEDRQEHSWDVNRLSGTSFRLPKIQSIIIYNKSKVHAPHTSENASRTQPHSEPLTTLTQTTKEAQQGEVSGGEAQLLPMKTILVWTYGYGGKTMGFGEGQAPFKTAGCEVDSCYLTKNKTMVPLDAFDATLFHFRSLKADNLPNKRSPHQRWVFWEMESASYVYQDPGTYNHLFNWTMTYRWDSDVQQRYGRVIPIPPSTSSTTSSTSPSASPPPGGLERNYAKGKTKMAAWFVSNCFTISRREKLVRYLKKHIQVDIYGKCGKLSCPREKTEECYDMLGQHYKFYLSFENSLCKDYVTEKLFSVLRHDVVPVVLGGSNYTSITPPHSIINVKDFPSITALINHLKYLDGNDTAYNEYFWWKKQYQVVDGWRGGAQGFCDLCKKLHEDQTPKVYSDIRDWFVGQGECLRLNLRVAS